MNIRFRTTPFFQEFGSFFSGNLGGREVVDFYGCLPVHVIGAADVEQAYAQAEMKGTPTWVCVPADISSKVVVD